MVNLPPLEITLIGAHPQNQSEGRGGVLPEAVVLHIAAGTLPGMDAWFNNPASGVSAHYGVGKAGDIHQYVAVGNTAFANGIVEDGHRPGLIDDNLAAGHRPNAWTISIEHEGQSGDRLSLAQWRASTALAAVLFRDHILPHAAQTGAAVNRDRILMHRDISPKSRPMCPGWDEAYQAAYIAEMARLLAGGGLDTRDLLDALTVQADDLEQRAHRHDMEAASCRMQAARLRDLVARFG